MSTFSPNLRLIILLVGVLVIVFWIAHPLIWQLFINSDTVEQKSKNVQIIAHRGASNVAPENTLSAVQKALEFGADMIEIDVHLSKDGQLVVLHDETLERTTNGIGKVSDYTLDELKLLDAGSWFNKGFEGEEIPTLTETLELIDGRATCLIEIKWGDDPYPNIGKKVAEEIINASAVDWTIVQSFESSYLTNIHKNYPQIHLGKLLIGSWQWPIPFYLDYKLHWGSYQPPAHIKWVNFHYKRTTPAFIKHLHSKGVKVGVFTVNSKAEIIKQGNMGVDAVISNNAEIRP